MEFKNMTENEQQIILKAEAEVLKGRLLELKEELINSAIPHMISNFDSSVEYAEDVLSALKDRRTSLEQLNLEPNDGYLIRDNFDEWSTHVSWTYKALKEFSDLLYQYKEVYKQLI